MNILLQVVIESFDISTRNVELIIEITSGMSKYNTIVGKYIESLIFDLFKERIVFY